MNDQLLLVDDPIVATDPVFLAMQKIVSTHKPGVSIVGVNWERNIFAYRLNGGPPCLEPFKANEIKGTVQIWHYTERFFI